MGNVCTCGKTQSSLHTRGLPMKKGANNRHRGTFVPSMKNFKNLRKVDDISTVYTFGTKLGEGSFGAVMKARRKGNDQECAIKVIQKASLNKNPMLPELMVGELSILKKTAHPKIMTVIEILHDDENFYIVSEILEGGELFDRLIEEKSFNEEKAALIIK